MLRHCPHIPDIMPVIMFEANFDTLGPNRQDFKHTVFFMFHQGVVIARR